LSYLLILSVSSKLGWFPVYWWYATTAQMGGALVLKLLLITELTFLSVLVTCTFRF